MRAKDYDRALAQYQQTLLTDAHNQGALLGAGQASFQLGRFRTAQRYLQAAVRADPENASAQRLLETAGQVLESDPSAPRISDAERNRRLRAAFLGWRAAVWTIARRAAELIWLDNPPPMTCLI